jgi:hypothetical protein
MSIAKVVPAPPPQPQPITWRFGGKGVNHIPVGAQLPVIPFGFPSGVGGTFPFVGGVATALRGVELLVENGSAGDTLKTLAQVEKLVGEVPREILDHTNQIRVVRGQDEKYDRYWEKRYNIPGFKAAAMGGGGSITFFGGKPYTDGALFHEVAHNLYVNERRWEDAAARDDKVVAQFQAQGALKPVELEIVPDPARRERWTPRLAPGGVTPYGDGRPAEDIAESMRLILSEKHYGKSFATITKPTGETRPLTFGEMYPNRVAVLQGATGARLIA